MNNNQQTRHDTDLDTIIVGAGFSGLYMLYRMRKLGLNARVIERGSGIGGTWFWNRYPGARCDIASMEYSYQFSESLQQEWEWSERYATQPEILRYIEHVADRFDLHGDIQLNTEVVSAHWDDDRACWRVKTADGSALTSRYVVMATGCLSSANYPAIPGLDTFRGALYHTGQWPHEGVDFTGKTVGIIGTGSSAIQSIPLIARQAAHLYVFQRTPNYSVPARNRPLADHEVQAVKARYNAFREANRATAFHADFNYNEAGAFEVTDAEREAEYERRWAEGGLPFMAAFADLLFDTAANDTAKTFIHGKIRDIVQDASLARKLSPDTVVGCKRLCVDTDYYATFNRDNVTLVDLNETPIRHIGTGGVQTSDTLFDLDALVCATGFDAMTGALMRIDIRGQGGRSIQQAWEEGPKTYLGLATTGFPNLFTVTGPGSPSVLTNMLPSIEHHVEWISDCIEHLEENKARYIDATPEAQEAWVAHVNEVGDTSLYPRCNSWYLGANVPGKPRVFMPYLGFPPYAQKCAEVAADNYAGFAIA